MEQKQKYCKRCKKKELLAGTKIPLCHSCRDELIENAKKGGEIALAAVGLLVTVLIGHNNRPDRK